MLMSDQLGQPGLNRARGSTPSWRLRPCSDLGYIQADTPDFFRDSQPSNPFRAAALQMLPARDPTRILGA
jgi:hypothetical protein